MTIKVQKAMSSLADVHAGRNDNDIGCECWPSQQEWEDMTKNKKSSHNDKAGRHTPPSARSAARMRVDYLLNDEGEEANVGSTFAGRSETPKSVIWDDLGEGRTSGSGISSSSSTSSSSRKHKSGAGGGTGTDGTGTGTGGHESGMGGKTSGSKEKKFQCDQCGFAFGMKSNLKRHVMTVHEDRRCWRCDICGAAFGLKQNLGTHVRVKHEKRRPFACDVCSVSFGYKQVLQNHRRNIHGLTD